ncbi:vWA domain-containing protein [Kribbella orskensis]|uniref:vWA domain-containing protein n=1 Tax=Kribbella orskensis TaxID=2512216 RepID=UPI0018EEC0FE|nr:VWA domain-containing protein [Kribbella orskensis]
MSQRLRGAGIAVDLTATETFSRSLAVLPPIDRGRLYWLSRITLVRDERDLAAYDAVFAAVFADAVLPVDPNARRQPRSTAAGASDVNVKVPATGSAEQDGAGLPWVTLPSVTGSAAETDLALGIPERLPSRLTGLLDTPFDELDPAELAAVGAWLEEARNHWPTRRSRRLVRRTSGRRIDLRATLATARRTGWEPSELVRKGQLDKPRRLVMVCDVSQSMQAFTRTYLHLMRAATVSADAEVFAFATTLTRLTAVLAHHDVSIAMQQATNLVADRFGGTRIAGNLRTLLRSRHGTALRGAVVIIASDGWDSDDPEQLRRVMARLYRRAYRVIWMNPRAAAPGYQPLAGGMAAARPYCDELLPGHTLRALENVVSSTR